MLLGRDEGGLFVHSTSLADDATAPCFEHDERFYSCPVAMAGTPFAHAAFSWHERAEARMLGTLGPMHRLTALCVAAIAEVKHALASRQVFELERAEKKRKRV